MILKPNKWHEFQHYKHRSPPWIKLQKSLLDNYEFHSMQDASKALAMCLWLVASEHLEGEIDASSERLAFRFRTTPEKIEKALKPLIDNGFFVVVQGASEMLAECVQSADTEKSREETESKRLALVVPTDCQSIFDHWRKVMGHEKSILDQKRTKLIKHALSLGYSVSDLCTAIDGCKLSPYHQGQNDTKSKYDGLDLILRDADKIDKFMAIAKQKSEPQQRRFVPA